MMASVTCSRELKLWGFPPQRGGSAELSLPIWHWVTGTGRGGCRKPEEEESWCGTPIVAHKRLNVRCCMDVSLRHLFITGFGIYLASVFNVRATRTAAARVSNTPAHSGILICQTRFRAAPQWVFDAAWHASYLPTHTGVHVQAHTQTHTMEIWCSLKWYTMLAKSQR